MMVGRTIDLDVGGEREFESLHAVSVQVEYGGDVPRFSEYFLSFNEDPCIYASTPSSQSQFAL